MKRGLTALVSLLTFTLLVALFFLWMNNRTPVVIGFIGPLTGKYADLGVHGRNGAILAVEDINAEGGINGRLLVLKAEDDHGTPEGAKEAFLRLKNAGVVAIVGPMLSTNAFALKPLLDEVHMVAISPTVSTTYLSGEKDYFFRVINDNGSRAKGLARFALTVLPPSPNPPRLWCLIYDLGNPIYTVNFISKFSETLSNKGDITACHIAYERDSHNIGNELQKVKIVKPDALVLAVSSIDGARILNWLKTWYPEVPVFGSAWMATDELIRRIHNDEHAPVFVEHLVEPSDLPGKGLAFKKRFESRYGKPPSFPALYSYDATVILARALRKAGVDTIEYLPEVLSSNTCYDCLIGKIEMDIFGDAKHPWWIYRIERGRFRFIKEEYPE